MSERSKSELFCSQVDGSQSSIRFRHLVAPLVTCKSPIRLTLRFTQQKAEMQFLKFIPRSELVYRLHFWCYSYMCNRPLTINHHLQISQWPEISRQHLQGS